MENKVQSDIQAAQRIILTRNLKRYGDYAHSFIPRFCSENISGYYNNINFEGKKVISYAGSGDQILNASLYGATDLEIFDKNRLTKYYVELKNVAKSILRVEEFLDFFMDGFVHIFEKRIYEKVKQGLSSDTKLFWDSLYNQFDGITIGKGLFKICSDPEVEMSQTNPYTNEEKFYELGSKKSDIKFIEGDVNSLPNEMCEKTYDIMLLPSCGDSINKFDSISQLEEYKETVLNLSKFLKVDGIILFAYMTGLLKNANKFKNPFYDKEIRNLVFDDEQFETMYFDSGIYYNDQDAVMLCKKMN